MKFQNPYAGLAANEIRRINVDVGKDDLDYLQSIRLIHGTLSTTVNILLQKLAHECRKRNILDFTQLDEFEDLVANSVFVNAAEYERLLAERILDRPAKRTPTKRKSRQSNNRAASRKGVGHKATADKSPNPQSEDGERLATE